MSDHLSASISTTSAYSIHFGRNLLSELAEYAVRNFSSQKVILIIDQQVNMLHHRRIDDAFSGTFKHVFKYIIPSGEQSKSMVQYSSIVDLVLKEQIDRNTVLVAIGGGVTGDLAGFVAASVMRGIPLIQVPTTLLAMVDSSIGGKTGVNHITGKNLIGSFYQPSAVYMDVEFLTTLPKNEWINGSSEIIKYGFIEDEHLLDELDDLLSGFDKDKPEEWLPVIRRSAEIKLNIVERDALEKGARAFLNFGHTFAHVIEQQSGYGTISHGEAVFAGMYGAVFMSNMTGATIDMELLHRFRSNYTFTLSQINATPGELTMAMLRDKKTTDQTIRVILINEPGKPYLHGAEDRMQLEESWNFVLEQFN